MWIGGRPLCLGCTCMAAGLVLGALVMLALGGDRVDPWSWAGLHVVLVGPTALQPWIQWKSYKATARLLLGVGTATWIIGFSTPRLTDSPFGPQVVAGLVTLVVVGRALFWLRERNAVSPCTGCPLGAYPTCSWNLPRLLEASTDPRLVEALAFAVPAGEVRVARHQPGERSRDPVRLGV